MSYRRFVAWSCITLTLFFMLHLILYQFTKEALAFPEKVLKRSAITGRCEPSRHVEITSVGDLARLSYLYRLGIARKVTDTSDRMGYLNKELGKNVRFPVVTVGDSYMWYNGDEKRFTSLLEHKLNINCYNMSANGVEDPFTFLQSNLKKDARILVWEAAERNISAGTFNIEKINDYYSESKKKMEYADRWDQKQAQHKQFRVINASNIKFLINNLSYILTGKPLIGNVGIVKLKNGNELMFYKDDLSSFERRFYSEDLTRAADFISYIDKRLKAEGITLIFFAIPDKYNAYYDEIMEGEKIKKDARFIEYLNNELRKRDVIAINLFEPFRNAIGQGSDLYHFDDTHWNEDGAAIAAELVAQEIQKHIVLD